MDVKEAITAAKDYVKHVYEDEQISNLGLEEVEHEIAPGRWLITLAFSRPWNTPRTRAQEVLGTLGSTPLKRSFKVVTVSEDGQVLSMKDRMKQASTE